MATTYKPRTAYLLIGSNKGDRKAFLTQAVDKINRMIGRVTEKSRLYETQAWGVTNQSDFLNQALAVETTQSPQKVLELILKIENEMGRMRTEKWAERTIDIDILMYDNFVVKEPNLVIPHPELPKRNFALIPLMEIAGEVEHPVLHLTIEEIYFDCNDPLDVILLDEK
ncbi:MAG: 2-amino-4-hydroxy-6-hydroxymethyldihydropteridine diphosphokinase [Saprospiraceae bacterium]|nr:2-amino-4-hydroxy-6-hydroxymethyldihydropteridine diphosphokinase [Saprospiraceae bacterium]